MKPRVVLTPANKIRLEKNKIRKVLIRIFKILLGQIGCRLVSAIIPLSTPLRARCHSRETHSPKAADLKVYLLIFRAYDNSIFLPAFSSDLAFRLLKQINRLHFSFLGRHHLSDQDNGDIFVKGRLKKSLFWPYSRIMIKPQPRALVQSVFSFLEPV